MGMQQELNQKPKWRVRHARDCVWGTMLAEGRNILLRRWYVVAIQNSGSHALSAAPKEHRFA